MINRRQLICAAGSTALFAHIPGAHAATYDLIIKGGRVIDPSAGLDAVYLALSPSEDWLGPFINGCRGGLLAGLNVTLPLLPEVMSMPAA